MTDEELKRKAKVYRENKKDLRYFSEPYKIKIENAYVAGAKENGVIWHDLRKNPKDLPNMGGNYLVYTGGNLFIIDFDTETNAFGYWCVVLGEDLEVCDDRFETLEERDEDEVIAWCELPKFEE